VLSKDDLLAMRAAASVHYLDPKLNRYIVDVVQATRNPGAYSDDLARWIRYGASPRASIALARCARSLAWMRGDDYVSPEHIQQVAPEILRHRLLLTFEAEAERLYENERKNSGCFKLIGKREMNRINTSSCNGSAWENYIEVYTGCFGSDETEAKGKDSTRDY